MSRTASSLRRCVLGTFAVLLLAARAFSAVEPGHVVINEVYFDPPEKTKPARFIELYNTTDAAVDLSNWQFTKEFGSTALGPFAGSLRSRGEKIELRDANKVVMEQFTYGSGFPWPTADAGVGASMELINPKLPRDNPASWRSSG